MGLVRRASETQPDVERRERPRDTDGLLAGLRDPRADVRRWAALDLAGNQDAVASLAARLGEEPDQAVRDALLGTLAEIGGAAVVDALVPYLRCEDAGVRNAVVECMSLIPASVEALPALLRDPDADVRAMTVMLLAALRDPRVPDLLLGVVACDPDPNVAGAAIGELAELGDETACNVIEAAAGRFPNDPFVAFAARTSLARLHDRP